MNKSKFWPYDGLSVRLWGIILSGLSLFLLTACQPDAAESPNQGRPLRVEVLVAERTQTSEIERTATGLVEARRSSALGFELAGTIKSIQVDEGDAVTAGDELAMVDQSRLRAAKREAKARVGEVEANLGFAQTNLKRIEQARKSEAVTAQALDEARREVASLEAGLRQAQARVESIEVDLKKSVLRAPYDGIIARRSADEGQVLAAGEPVLHLLEGGAKVVVIGTSESLAETLKSGDPSTLTINGREYQGVVKSLLPDRTRQTRTVMLRLTVDDPEEQIRAGSLASIRLTKRLEQAGFWLPQSALTDNLRGLWAAYIVETDEESAETVARVDLEMLHSEADRVYVRGGLRPGDRVVASGLQRLSPGMRVATSELRRNEP